MDIEHLLTQLWENNMIIHKEYEIDKRFLLRRSQVFKTPHRIAQELTDQLDNYWCFTWRDNLFWKCEWFILAYILYLHPQTN